MEFRDYYTVLGVARTATAEEIKKSYRRLARKFHPDVSKEADAEAKFKEVQEAYEVLKDPEKRAAYDRLGSEWRTGQDFRPPPDWETQFRAGGAGASARPSGADPEFSDFFDQLFGARSGFGGTRGGRSASIIHARADIDLEDAFRGGTRDFQLAGGAARKVSVRIPPGVVDGDVVHAQSPGDKVAVDVLVEIHIRPHPLFALEGRDVVLSLPVAPWELALGASVRVPTLDGEVEMRIPPGAQSGQRLRLKGRGLPGDPPGAQIVTLKVVLPSADSPRAKALYEQMRTDLAFDPRATLRAQSRRSGT